MRRGLLVLLALLFAGGAVQAIVADTRTAAQADAYEASPPCPAAAPATTCRARLPATVAAKNQKRSGRTSTYWFDVAFPDRSTVNLYVTEAQWNAAARGAAIELERWNGRVTRLFVPGVAEEEIPDTPRRFPQLPIMTIVLALIAAGVLWVGLLAGKRGRAAT